MARPRVHNVNEHFFDLIDNETKAYWLGFLYADGHPAIHALMLGLAPVDSEHVERFRSALGSEHAIRYSEKCTSVAISSRYLSARVRFLRNAVFLPDKHVNHFVRGVFDGDGCACKSTRGFFSVSVAGNRRLLQRIKFVAGIARGYIKKHSKPFTSTYILWYTTLVGICAFRDWIYRDATIFLKRKKIILDGASPLLNRVCFRCGAVFAPRYSNKGAYCGRHCYMQDYYAANRERKWKKNGEWR